MKPTARQTTTEVTYEHMVGMWQPWYATGVFRVVVRVRSENALTEEDAVTVRTAIGRSSRNLRSRPHAVITDGERKKALAAIQSELTKWVNARGTQEMAVTEIVSVEGP